MTGSVYADDGVAGDRPRRGGWGLWGALTGLAELVALLLGASWWIWTDTINPDPDGFFLKLCMLVMKSFSGVVHGVALGLVQGGLMRRRLPDLSLSHWIAATGAVAVVGWAVGSAFSIFGATEGGGGYDPSPGQAVVRALALGLVAGTLFGGVQALALGGLGVKRWPWIVGNALGWALGLPWLYLAAWGSVIAPVWALGAISGLLAGAMVGIMTALAFSAMTRSL